MGKSLDSLIDKYINEERIVGTVVIAAKSGEIVYKSARGLSDRENNVKMKDSDQFRYTSISKVFTNSAILRLMDKGLISPEQNIREYLPDFAPKLADGSTPKIKISHLLSHCAGLSYDFVEDEFGPYQQAGVSNGFDNSTITLEENIKNIAKVPLSYTPGQAWCYSVASDVLGAVIEKVVGNKLSNAIDSLVNKPLGLLTPAFSAKKGEIVDAYFNDYPRPLKMKGVTTLGLGGKVTRFDSERIFNEHAFQSGGAGMKGNAQDIFKLLEAIREGDFISKENRNLAKTPITKELPEFLGPGRAFSYLFSNIINPAKAGLKFGKNTISWGGAYGHSWLVDFENKITLVALTNTTFEGMSGKFKEDLFAFASENFV